MALLARDRQAEADQTGVAALLPAEPAYQTTNAEIAIFIVFP